MGQDFSASKGLSQRELRKSLHSCVPVGGAELLFVGPPRLRSVPLPHERGARAYIFVEYLIPN